MKKKPTSLTIQPGCLYYLLDDCPIGSKTGRAPDKGLTVTDIEEISKWHECDRIGVTAAGQRIAFTIEFTKERYSHAKY